MMTLLGKRLYLLFTLSLITPTLSWGDPGTTESSSVTEEETVLQTEAQLQELLPVLCEEITTPLTEAELDQCCVEQTTAIEALESQSRTIRAERRENYTALTKTMIARFLDKFPKARFPRITALLNKLWYKAATPEQTEFYNVQVFDKHDAKALQIPCHYATITLQPTLENAGLVTVPLIDGNDGNNLHALCHNKEELSAVLAHETAHLYQSHPFKKLIAYTGYLTKALPYATAALCAAHNAKYTYDNKQDQQLFLKNKSVRYNCYVALVVGALLSELPLFLLYSRILEREADKLSIDIDTTHAPSMATIWTRCELAQMLWDEFLALQPQSFFENTIRKTEQFLGRTIGKFFRTHPTHTERIKTCLKSWKRNYVAQLQEGQEIDAATAQEQAEAYVREAYTALVDKLTLRAPEEVHDIMMSTFGLSITVRRPLQKPFVFTDETVAALHQKVSGEFRDKLLALAA